MPDIREPGDSITADDVTIIMETFRYRQKNFPGESEDISMRVVLLNVGDGMAPVECVNGEFSGLKRDISMTGTFPKCPNNHVMLEGKGVKLGWVSAD